MGRVRSKRPLGQADYTRNHHPSKVVIIGVEKMIPSAARAITAGIRASFDEAPRSQCA
jgi:hypothetical protein